MGGANVAAGLFQGFAISASGSRTAVAEQSGSKSQVTGMVGAAVVACSAVLPPLLQNLPQPALAAVVIVAAISLFGWSDPSHVLPHAQVRLRDLAGDLARRDPVRCPGGHPDRRRAVDPAVLPAQLVAGR